MRLLLALGAVLMTMLAAAAPVRAGGWAVTLLDPLPDRIEPARAYTVGYWVLQHGSHPSAIPLQGTGLRLVDEQGVALTFRGTALQEAAHFATAISLPRAGRWQLFGMQSPFGDYHVGALDVPGGLSILPTPAPMPVHDEKDHWQGAIRPPVVLGEPGAESPPRARPAGGQPPAAEPALPLLPVGAGLAVLAGMGLILVARRRAPAG